MKNLSLIIILSIFFVNIYSQEQKFKFSELPTELKLKTIENTITVFEVIVLSIAITTAFYSGGFTVPIICSVILVTTEVTFLVIERRIKKRKYK